MTAVTKFADRLTATAGDTNSLNGRVKALRTLVQAAGDDQNHSLIRQALQMAKRFGVSLDPEAQIDPIALDRDFKASRATTEEKIRFKTLLAMLGVLR